MNSLATEAVACRVFDSVDHLVVGGRWHVRLLVLMPDHLHALVSVPRDESLRRLVPQWKHFLAHEVGIHWQRGFFEHRLRNGESLDEKAAYIRNNPVRAGLVASAENWPYRWEYSG